MGNSLVQHSKFKELEKKSVLSSVSKCNVLILPLPQNRKENTATFSWRLSCLSAYEKAVYISDSINSANERLYLSLMFL